MQALLAYKMYLREVQLLSRVNSRCQAGSMHFSLSGMDNNNSLLYAEGLHYPWSNVTRKMELIT